MTILFLQVWRPADTELLYRFVFYYCMAYSACISVFVVICLCVCVRMCMFMQGSGHRQPPAVLVWLQCGYRCFTLLLVKLSEREKLLPLFVWEGKSEQGSREFSVYGWSIDILIHDLSLCLLNALAMHSRAVPILFLNQIQVSKGKNVTVFSVFVSVCFLCPLDPCHSSSE